METDPKLSVRSDPKMVEGYEQLPDIVKKEVNKLNKKKLIDEIHLFKAPFIIGEKGIPVIKGNNLKRIDKKLLEKIIFDDNSYFKYQVK